MIALLLGSDTLAKQQYIAQSAKQRGAEVETYSEASVIPEIDQLFEPQLFGPQKIVVFNGAWKKLDSELLLEKVGENKTALAIIVEDSLDKRKKINQEFLQDSRVKVLHMDSPVGAAETVAWIKKYASENKINIDLAAIQSLAHALIPNGEAVLNIARAQNELEKLKQFEGGDKISQEAVKFLVESEISVDIFALLNCIATNDKKQALTQLENYFAIEGGDEKSNAIKFVALLADQFRSLLMVVDAGERRMPDAKLLELTGWKSGRLFVLKKLARNFKQTKIKQTLAKLENLDRELKSSAMPPHVVLDLIIAGI